jgi:hypothetical protein
MPRLNAELAEVAKKFPSQPCLRSLRSLRFRDFFTRSEAGRHSLKPRLARDPVAFVPSKQEADGNHCGREQRQTDNHTCAPAERCQRERQLRDGDEKEDTCVTNDAVAAERTMPRLQAMDVAREVGACPQRTAATGEDPRADVDEKRAGCGERDGERHQAIKHERPPRVAGSAVTSQPRQGNSGKTG